jgi:hypothetical protein
MTTRRPLAVLVPLALCVALLAGCGDDDPEAGPAQTSGTTTTGAPSEPSEPTATDPDDPPATPGGDQELCDVFARASEAVAGVGSDFPSGEGDPVPSEMLDALHQWGQDLADADVPTSMGDDQREGLGVMSGLLLAIPDDATGGDLSALDDAISDTDNAKVQAVTDWVGTTCGDAGF